MHRGTGKHRNVVGALRNFILIVPIFLVIWEAERVSC